MSVDLAAVQVSKALSRLRAFVVGGDAKREVASFDAAWQRCRPVKRDRTLSVTIESLQAYVNRTRPRPPRFQSSM